MTLFLNDLYFTVQGEGLHTGRRALFVRMPFCSLACSWCDTQFNTYRRVTLEEFEAKAMEEPTRMAVITGGEPLMHRHTPAVIAKLEELGFEDIHVETNGMFPRPLDRKITWIVCSPKRDAEYFIHPELRPSELRYVVDEAFEWDVLEKHNTDYGRTLYRLTLSPEASKEAENRERIMEYIKAHPWWILNTQSHKHWGMP